MGKTVSTFLHWVGRFVKLVIGLSLIPPFVGVILGIRDQLDVWLIGPRSFAEWIALGSFGYVGVHLFLYKPKALFRVQHRLLSRLSLWLFGGQVTTASPKGEKGEKGEKKVQKSQGPSDSPQGSTLLVLSPYLVPLYTILICFGSWVLRRWTNPPWLDPAVGVLLGATLTLHWVMAADDLQQDRGRFPLDAYLLSVTLIGVVSLLAVAVCLLMAVPGFSLPGMFAESLSRARAIYTAVLRTLFL